MKIRQCFPWTVIIGITIVIQLAPAYAASVIPGPVTVTDFRGKQLNFQKPVTRIVCLIESALSGIYMLGEEKRIIGISVNIYNSSVYSYYAAMDSRIRKKKVPAPGNWDFVSIESVIALKPDLVVIWADQTESIHVLEERGIPVYGVFISKKEDVYKEIRDFGILTGSTPRAETLVKYTQDEIRRFGKRAAAARTRPSVYYMWAQGNLETSCGGSTVNDLIDMAGGRNVCAAITKEHAVVNRENLIGWNPDIIVMWHNEKTAPSDLMADPQWKMIKAIQNKKVYQLPEVFLCDLWTLKFLYSIKLVATWTHPELFRDIDPVREKEEMLRTLYGRKLQGI
ncbi:MAG: ABC transporter substrate-binding protein [Thermodesulfovibrionales bacterium]